MFAPVADINRLGVMFVLVKMSFLFYGPIIKNANASAVPPICRQGCPLLSILTQGLSTIILFYLTYLTSGSEPDLSKSQQLISEFGMGFFL